MRIAFKAPSSAAMAQAPHGAPAEALAGRGRRRRSLLFLLLGSLPLAAATSVTASNQLDGAHTREGPIKREPGPPSLQVRPVEAGKQQPVGKEKVQIVLVGAPPGNKVVSVQEEDTAIVHNGIDTVQEDGSVNHRDVTAPPRGAEEASSEAGSDSNSSPGASPRGSAPPLNFNSEYFVETPPGKSNPSSTTRMPPKAEGRLVFPPSDYTERRVRSTEGSIVFESLPSDNGTVQKKIYIQTPTGRRELITVAPPSKEEWDLLFNPTGEAVLELPPSSSPLPPLISATSSGPQEALPTSDDDDEDAKSLPGVVDDPKEIARLVQSAVESFDALSPGSDERRTRSELRWAALATPSILEEDNLLAPSPLLDSPKAVPRRLSFDGAAPSRRSPSPRLTRRPIDGPISKGGGGGGGSGGRSHHRKTAEARVEKEAAATPLPLPVDGAAPSAGTALRDSPLFGVVTAEGSAERVTRIERHRAASKGGARTILSGGIIVAIAAACLALLASAITVYIATDRPIQ